MHDMSGLKLSKKWDHMNFLKCVLMVGMIMKVKINGGSVFHNRKILLKFEWFER